MILMMTPNGEKRQLKISRVELRGVESDLALDRYDHDLKLDKHPVGVVNARERPYRVGGNCAGRHRCLAVYTIV